MSSTRLTDEDEGKKVVTTNGDEIGRITEVRSGTAHVDPDAGMFDSVKAKLDWGDAGEDTYPLTEDKIADVTDDEVRIQ